MDFVTYGHSQASYFTFVSSHNPKSKLTGCQFHLQRK